MVRQKKENYSKLYPSLFFLIYIIDHSIFIIADKKGYRAQLIKTVNESSKLREKMSEYDLAKGEFIRIPNSKGDTLNSWILKPANFDPSRRYPVLFCNYGGPGSQQVANRFGAISFWPSCSSAIAS